MLAWCLRGILLTELMVAAVFLPVTAERFGAVWAVVVLAALALLGVPTLLLALGYGVTRWAASPRPPGIGPITPAAVLGEALAFLVGFVAIMPAAKLWMGSDAVGRLPAGARPVLLVHGYMCNRGFWWWMRRQLRARGFAVATVDLEGPFGDLDRLADVLDARIDALLAETGADRVLLVTHSMGGLVARAVLRRGRAARVARLVTLGGPHHGTVTARLGLGRNARAMEPGSPWLAALNRDEAAEVPTLTIWSCGDEIVAPQATSRLAGAREVVLPALGHMALGASATVRDLIVEDLRRDPAPLKDAGRA